MTTTVRAMWLLAALTTACASYAYPGLDDRDTPGTTDVSADPGADRDVRDAVDAPEGPADAGASEVDVESADATVGVGWVEVGWSLPGDLNAAWGRHFDDLVAVGDGGAVVRFNGRWAAPLDAGTGADLYAVDGAPGVVALAGAGGTLLVSRDGGAFAPVVTGVTTPLRGVAVASADDLLAVGDGGTILQVTEGQVEEQASNTTTDLLAAWRGPDGDAVALDAAGGVLRRLNGVWLRTQVAHGPVRLLAAAGADTLHLLVAGEHGFLGTFDGLAWTALLSNDAAGRDLAALRVLPDGEAWAAGAGGVLLRRAAGAAPGAAFALAEVLGPSLIDASFHGLVVEKVDGKVRGLLAGAGAALLVNGGDGWRDASTAPGQTLREAMPLADGRVLAVGDSGLVGVLAGGRWSALPLDEARDLDGVAQSTDGEAVWIGSVGGLVRLELADWTMSRVPLAIPGRVRSISRDVVVGDGGLLGRLGPQGAVRVLAVPAGVGRLHAVATCDDGTAWAAGDDGVLLRVKGDQALRIHLETFETLRSVTCSENGSLAAGDNGVVVEADATGGRVIRREAGALWQAAVWHDGRAWLAGIDGRVLHGTPAEGWTSQDLPAPIGVHALTVAGDGSLLAFGVNGRAFRLEAP